MSILSYFMDYQKEIFDWLYSENSFLLYCVLCAFGTIYHYFNEETKIPFLEKQVKSFLTSNLLLLKVTTFSYLGLSIILLLVSMKESGFSISTFLFSFISANKIIGGFSLICLAIVINYSILKFSVFLKKHKDHFCHSFVLILLIDCIMILLKNRKWELASITEYITIFIEIFIFFSYLSYISDDTFTKSENKVEF